MGKDTPMTMIKKMVSLAKIISRGLGRPNLYRPRKWV